MLNKKIVAGITIAVIAAVIAVALFTTFKSNPSKPPNAAVVNAKLRTDWVNDDYVAWIDVTIHNSGGKGLVTVYVEVYQDFGIQEVTLPDSQTVAIGEGESKDLTFEFTEVGDVVPIVYNVWIE